MKLPSVFLFAFAFIYINARAQSTTSAGKVEKDGAVIKFDDTRKIDWPEDFKVVDIISSKDRTAQKSYFFKSKSDQPRPLIVSLHTWSGDYTQRDEVAPICQEKDLNYIHPNFRGANVAVSACCSELALSDIDDAIDYAIRHMNVDTSKIYVIGVSGGGYATLSTFMKSRHHIRKFSAWASITSLEAWYHESSIRGNKYAKNVLDCTGSQNVLNVENAREKSPLFMTYPGKIRKDSKLYIYAGIYDGIQGSVPITHSINFYNKLLKNQKISDKSKGITDQEKLHMLEFRTPLGEFGKIEDRKICLKKESGNISIIIFEGAHEMLPTYAMEQLLKD